MDMVPGQRSQSRDQLYYRHSGRSSPLGILVCTLVSVAVGFAAALLYARVDYMSPLVYLNCVLVAGFGWVLGAGVALGARYGKVRSMTQVTYMASVTAMLSYAISWVAWLKLVHASSVDYVELVPAIDSPSAVWQMLALVYENGAWYIGHSPMLFPPPAVNGPLLGAVWLGEAVGVIATAIVIARMRWFDHPFCERCGQWCSTPQIIHSYGPAASAAEIKIHLEQGDWEFLGTVPMARARNTQRLDLMHQCCERCGILHMLSLRRVTIIPHPTGNKEEFILVMDRLLVSTKEVKIIMTIPPRDAAEAPTPRSDYDYVDLGL